MSCFGIPRLSKLVDKSREPKTNIRHDLFTDETNTPSRKYNKSNANLLSLTYLTIKNLKHTNRKRKIFLGCSHHARED